MASKISIFLEHEPDIASLHDRLMEGWEVESVFAVTDAPAPVVKIGLTFAGRRDLTQAGESDSVPTEGEVGTDVPKRSTEEPTL